MRASTFALFALPVCAAACAPPAEAATLDVTVDNVRDARGHVRIGVCTKAEFLGERCRYHAVVPSAAGRVEARIAVQPGTYAIAAYQDATDAGHLRRTFLGIPKDGTGFSRDPSLRFGPPSFADSALSVGAGDSAVTIHLRYF
jgi:uncharacterized protein (DUF2141 family)